LLMRWISSGGGANRAPGLYRPIRLRVKSDRLLGDLNAEAAERAASALGGKALGSALDVRDTASVQRFFAAAERELGPVTVAVANATPPRAASQSPSSTGCRATRRRWRRR
jgi:NAD(P)-dependent dehydrogenase (short-subunit alcohol dehydrogenase family)